VSTLLWRLTSTPRRATMAALMEEALEAHLAKLEKQRGEPFPRRGGAIHTGRPVKAGA
jgi:class 3 adenylate cyclase